MLTLLLAAEGVTIVRVGQLLSLHMFIGLTLIGPVVVKLASTGYRMARYYAGARPYREKGPPALGLRVLAPALVVATIVVFASGVLLLLHGQRSDSLLLIHKASFFVWGAVFAVHFLAHLPSVVRSLPIGRGAARAARVPGFGLRAAALAASIGGGLGLALAVLGAITRWHGGHRFG